MPVSDGMVVRTNTPNVKKAREGVMEFLLINHPLDCPICDQGGECDLQDQAFKYGKGKNRFHENKRTVKDKNMGPLIQTHMTRCIHCTRCIRFMSDIAGVEELGATSRGEHMEITTYLERGLKSELSGNIIDVCPVGALNSKPYAYTARKWELSSTESIDVFDAMGSNIRVDTRGLEVMRILPLLNEDVNEEWISDKIRFSYDGLKLQRIDRAYIKEKNKLTPKSLDDVISKVAELLKSSNPSEIGAISGDMSDCETIFSLKSMLQKLGCSNYDFNEKNYNFDYSSRGNYIFNSGFSGLEDSDLVVLIGANIRKNAPVLGARLGKLVRFNDLRVYNLAEEIDHGFDVINIGDDLSILEQVESDNHDLSKDLANAKNPVFIIGDAVYTRDDSLAIMKILSEIASKYGAIRDDWNGFNILQNTASITGAIDLGFFPSKASLGASQMLEKLESGELKILILAGADNIDLPKNHNGTVIYIGHHGDKSANNADIILPAAAFTEKDSTFVNNEGRIQYTRKAVPAPGDAKADYDLILAISNKLGLDLGFNDLASLRKEMLKLMNGFKPHSEKTEIKTKQTKISKAKLANIKTNFYQTNTISRASKTMAACVKEFEEGEARI